MKKKILIVGFACLSLLAVAGAQSDKTSGQTASAKDAKPRDAASGQASGKMVQQPAGSHAALNSSEQVSAPRDVATGQASGKRQYAPVVIRKVSDDSSISAREAQSGMATGKATMSGQPAITENKKPVSGQQNGNSQTRVAAGDVNGDGKADLTVQHDVKSPRDSSTGMATGKRQHQPMTVTKEVGPSSPQK
jgi:hypothetical protein